MRWGLGAALLLVFAITPAQGQIMPDGDVGAPGAEQPQIVPAAEPAASNPRVPSDAGTPDPADESFLSKGQEPDNTIVAIRQPSNHAEGERGVIRESNRDRSPSVRIVRGPQGPRGPRGPAGSLPPGWRGVRPLSLSKATVAAMVRRALERGGYASDSDVAGLRDSIGTEITSRQLADRALRSQIAAAGGKIDAHDKAIAKLQKDQAATLKIVEGLGGIRTLDWFLILMVTMAVVMAGTALFKTSNGNNGGINFLRPSGGGNTP